MKVLSPLPFSAVFTSLIRSKLCIAGLMLTIETGFPILFLDLKWIENLLSIKNNLLYAKVFSYTGDVLNGRSNVTLLNEKLNLIKNKTGSKFISNNHSEFVKLSNTAMIYAGQLYVYRAMAVSQKEKATELIKLIQEEIK